MSRTVKLSVKTAKRLLDALETASANENLSSEETSALEQLRFALRAPPKRAKPPEVTGALRYKAQKKATKKAQTRDIRAACMARDGRCINCRATEALQLDHFWGRARAESVESCWMLCAKCHRMKTDSKPDRLAWLSVFTVHCDGLGYVAEAAKARSRCLARESIKRLG